MGFKKYLSILITFVTVLIFVIPTQSQIKPASTIYARRLSIHDGLSSNLVKCLFQDSKGFIWVGTKNGLNKYDGYTFKKYLEEVDDSIGLEHNIVSSICEDNSGTIWAATLSGLVAIDRKTDKVTLFHHDKNNIHSIASDNVSTTFTDSKGRLWIGYGNGELDEYITNKKIFRHFGNLLQKDSLGKIDNRIVRIVEVQEDCFIISNRLNIISFNPNSGAFTSDTIRIKDGHTYSNVQVFTDNVSKKSLTLFRNIINKWDVLWQGTPFQLSENKLSRSSDNSPFDNPNFQIIFRGGERYWFPSKTHGLMEVDFKKNSITPLIVSDGIKPVSNIDGAIQIKDGSVWLLTGNGLYVMEDARNSFTNYSLVSSTTSSSVLSVRTLLFARDNTLWVGTANSNGAIFYYDTTTSDFINNKTIYSSKHCPYSCNRIVQDKFGHFWGATTRGGFYSMAFPYKKTISRYNDLIKGDVYDIFIDAEGLLWLCCYNGSDGGKLININPLILELKKYGYPNTDSLLKPAVWSVSERDKNSLWVATNHGLFIFDKTVGKFNKCYCHQRTDAGSLSHNDVWVLYTDSKSRLWVGTWGGGLNLFDKKNETFTHFTKDNGLPSNWIQSILEDSVGNLWIATSKGISCFNPEQKTFTNYTTADGLMDDEFASNAAVVSPTGKFFFGGINGITSFYPDQVKRKIINYPLVLTDFRVFDKILYGEITNNDKIFLNYNENYFSVDATYIDFQDPSQKKYEYMLEGYDEQWIRAGDRRNISYNRIAPGKYTLHVRVFSGGDNKVRNEISAVIIISPPFWKTWWFRIVVMFFILFITGFFIYVKQLRRRKFNEQIKQATENERLQLASELHDGPLQDLYATRFLLEPFLEKFESEDSLKTKDLDRILKKVRSDLRTLTGKLQLPDFELGLGEALKFFCNNFKDSHPSINIIQNIEYETLRIPLKISENIFRIFRTAMANVGKHSKATEVNINFTANNKILRLTIADNGIGFEIPRNWNKYLKNKHYGIFLMQSQANNIKAKLNIISERGNGTMVTTELNFYKRQWKL